MKKNEDKPVVIKLDRKKIKQSAKGRVKRNYNGIYCRRIWLDHAEYVKL